MYYIIEKVPTRYLDPQAVHDGVTLWYCHMDGFSHIPVFGSIGTYQTAAAACRIRNLDGKVRRR